MGMFNSAWAIEPTLQCAVHEDFAEMHVLSKNVQGTRADRRLEDLLLEMALYQFGLLCLSNLSCRWGRISHGDRVYLSGGCMCRGVGVTVSLFQESVSHFERFCLPNSMTMFSVQQYGHPSCWCCNFRCV